MAGIELSADDRAGMSPDEIEALTGADAEQNLKAHGDTAPATDDQAPAGDPPAADAPAAESAAETPPAEGDTPSADDLAAVIEAEQPAAPQAQYKVDGPADFKAERAALRGQKDDIEAKWGAGELTDAERAASLSAIDDQIDDLLIAHTRAETLRTANQQAAEQSMTAAVVSVLQSAKKAGTIDYGADQKAAKQFDTMLGMLIADPENAGKTPAELTADAHRSVLALRGIVEKPAAATPNTPTPPARRDVPRATLADMPNAAPTGMEDESLMKFSTLEGEDAEEYLSRLPPREAERLMRAADATSMKFSGDARSRRERANA